MKVIMFFRHKHEFESDALHESFKSKTPVFSFALLKLKATIKSDWSPKNIEHIKNNMAYDKGSTLPHNILEAYILDNNNVATCQQYFLLNSKNEATAVSEFDNNPYEQAHLLFENVEKTLFEKLDIKKISSLNNNVNSQFFKARGYNQTSLGSPNEHVIRSILTKEKYFEREKQK